MASPLFASSPFKHSNFADVAWKMILCQHVIKLRFWSRQGGISLMMKHMKSFYDICELLGNAKGNLTFVSKYLYLYLLSRTLTLLIKGGRYLSFDMNTDIYISQHFWVSRTFIRLLCSGHDMIDMIKVRSTKRCFIILIKTVFHTIQCHMLHVNT